MGHRSEERGFYHCLMTPSDICMLLLVSLWGQQKRQNCFRDHLHWGGTERAGDTGARGYHVSGSNNRKRLSNAVICLSVLFTSECKCKCFIWSQFFLFVKPLSLCICDSNKTLKFSCSVDLYLSLFQSLNTSVKRNWLQLCVLTSVFLCVMYCES